MQTVAGIYRNHGVLLREMAGSVVKDCSLNKAKLQTSLSFVDNNYCQLLQAGYCHEQGIAYSGIIFWYLVTPGLKPGAIEAGKLMAHSAFLKHISNKCDICGIPQINFLNITAMDKPA